MMSRESSVSSTESSDDPTILPEHWRGFPATSYIFTPNRNGKENAHLFVKEFGNNHELGRRYALRGEYYHCMVCIRKNKSKRAVVKNGNVYVLLAHRCTGVEMKSQEREVIQQQQNPPENDDPMEEADEHVPPIVLAPVAQPDLPQPAPHIQPPPRVGLLKTYKKADFQNAIIASNNAFESNEDADACAKIIYESVKLYTEEDEGTRDFKEISSRIARKMTAKFGHLWFCVASDHRFFLSTDHAYVDVTLEDLFIQATIIPK